MLGAVVTILSGLLGALGLVKLAASKRAADELATRKLAGVAGVPAGDPPPPAEPVVPLGRPPPPDPERQGSNSPYSLNPFGRGAPPPPPVVDLPPARGPDLPPARGFDGGPRPLPEREPRGDQAQGLLQAPPCPAYRLPAPPAAAPPSELPRVPIDRGFPPRHWSER